MKFHLITVVWGARYTELFVNLIIPTQLSSGNLPALKHKQGSLYKIYAPAADIVSIRESAAFPRLAAAVSVQFVEIAGVDGPLLKKWPYDVMTRCHKHALDDAVAAGAAAVFLAPDAILCDGSFAALERRALEGHRLLLTSGLLVALEGARPGIEARCRELDGSIKLTSPAAVAMARRNPQSHVEKLEVSGAEFANEWPSYLWMPVNEHSMVYRAWHLHPILVFPDRKHELVDTIDSGELFEAAVANRDSVHIFCDSNEFCCLELSPYEQRAGYLKNLAPFCVDQVANWVGDHTAVASRDFCSRSILYDGGDATEDEVEAADEMLRHTVDAVLSRLERPNILAVRSIEEIDRTRRTFIYGSGAFGQELASEMGEHGNWCFEGFVDSHRSGTCRGFPVLDLPTFLARYRSGDQVIVASMYLGQISRALVQAGILDFAEAGGWFRARRHAERVGMVHFRAGAVQGCSA